MSDTPREWTTREVIEQAVRRVHERGYIGHPEAREAMRQLGIDPDTLKPITKGPKLTLLQGGKP